ncbi:MAG: glycosyl transferase family 90 [Simkaniaceae bacterium]
MKSWAYSFDAEQLKQKIQSPPPAWMMEQIEKDLKHFPQVTKEKIFDTYDTIKRLKNYNNSDLVVYEIIDGKISFRTEFVPLKDHRIKAFINMIESTSSIVPWPNVLFLASVWDSFDFGYFLREVQAPVFAIAKKKNNPFVVLMPEITFEGFRKGALIQIEKRIQSWPWDRKKPSAFFRGNSTGYYWDLDDFDEKARVRILFLSDEYGDLIDAALTGSYFTNKQVKEFLENEEYFTSFSWPYQQLPYRFLLAIDGNTFPSSFRWQLATNCCVIKQESSYIEWFYNALEENVHYWSVDSNFSNLIESLNYLMEHDQLAQKIAESGRKFYKEHLTNEDVILYTYLLLETYKLRFVEEEKACYEG